MNLLHSKMVLKFLLQNDRKEIYLFHEFVLYRECYLLKLLRHQRIRFTVLIMTLNWKITFGATLNTARKLRNFYPHLIKLLATNFSKSLLNVSTRLKSFEFHLGYRLFQHLRKHVSNPPTYAEISQITKRMKSSESPCPLDQISIPTFVFNSYYHRNLEEKSHTTGLEKNHYYSYSQKWQYQQPRQLSSHDPGNINT